MGKKQKTGMSLIVLTITIIVMIILAGAIILTLNNSSVMDRAREAKFKNDIRSIQEELSLRLFDELADSENGNISNINGPAEQNLSSAEKYPGIFIIENGKLLISSEASDKQKEIAKDLGIGEKKEEARLINFTIDG